MADIELNQLIDEWTKTEFEIKRDGFIYSDRLCTQPEIWPIMVVQPDFAWRTRRNLEQVDACVFVVKNLHRVNQWGPWGWGWFTLTDVADPGFFNVLRLKLAIAGAVKLRTTHRGSYA